MGAAQATRNSRRRDPGKTSPKEDVPIDQAVAIQAFVAQAPIAVAMTDLKLRFVKASSAFLADFGMEEGELLGRTSYELAPDTEAKYAGLHQRCLAGESVSSSPERIVLPNGRHRWMMWDAAPWRDNRGDVGGLLIMSRDVTAQMDAEQEVRRTRAFLDCILQNTPSAMVVKDEFGRVLVMNRAMEQMYGVTAEEHVGQTIFDVLPEADARRIAAEDRRVLTMNAPLIIEHDEMRTHDKGMRHVRKTKVAIRDEAGANYLLAINEDITERWKTQTELERTRAFLETLIQSVPISLVVKDAATGRILITNRANEELLGIPGQDIIGKSADELFPQKEADHFVAEDRRVLESGELLIKENTTVTTPSHGVRILRQMKVAVRAPDGSAYILTISDDITERKRAAEELERTKAFLQTVIENVPAGLTVKDAADGRIVMTNPAVEQMYGVGRGENLGKTGGDIFSPEQARRSAELDRQVLESGEVKVFEAEPISTPNGVRFLRKKKIGIRNADGRTYLLSISEDVTDRKLAEDTLKQALADAEAANVAKSEFLANMSHEIRTPLNGVLGLADALANMDLTPQQSEIVGMIVTSGKALTAILSDVLDLAKAEAGQLQLQPEAFSLSETIGSSSYLFETAARSKGLDFQVVIDAGDTDRLVGDPLRIRQIVSNLISNAVKFTDQGQVLVHARATPTGDGRATLEVIVSDTGPGFSEEVRSRLFSRFEQGDGSITRKFGGTGLGLSIVGALAEMMGGEINCAATPGHGATFTFRAPLQIAEAAAPVAAEEKPVSARLKDQPLRVLLAEDHAVNRKVVQLMLGSHADIVVAEDGAQAVKVFLDHGPFDVVLMDTQMPVMDGLTATRQIRAAELRLGSRRTPIVSLTANAMAHQVEACREAGADFHLAKPITSKGLIAVIDSALEAAKATPGARAASRAG